MKKRIAIIISIIILIFGGCTITWFALKNDKDTKIEEPTKNPDDKVAFVDSNLEKYLQEILNTKEITYAKLEEIEELYLENKELTTLEDFKYFKNLKSLYARGNTLKDLKGIGDLNNLIYLNLSNSDISDIEPLTNLTNLRGLDVSNNKIKDISSISKMKNLKSLNLSNNQLTDIKPISELKDLRHLDLQGNLIKDISPLKVNTNVQMIFLNDNLITDCSPLVELKKLYDIPVLDLNPILNYEVLEKNLQIYYENYLNYDMYNIGFVSILDQSGEEIHRFEENDYNVSNEEDAAQELYDTNKRFIKYNKDAVEIATKFVKNNIKENSTEVEKVKILTRYLSELMTYNYDLAEDANQFDINPSAYYAFILKSGICQDYTYAFLLLGTIANLEVYAVNSVPEGCHVWNAVRVKEKIYQLDVTWADKSELYPEYNDDPVDWEFALISNQKMNELHNFDSDYSVSPILYNPDISLTEDLDISK